MSFDETIPDALFPNLSIAQARKFSNQKYHTPKFIIIPFDEDFTIVATIREYLPVLVPTSTLATYLTNLSTTFIEEKLSAPRPRPTRLSPPLLSSLDLGLTSAAGGLPTLTF